MNVNIILYIVGGLICIYLIVINVLAKRKKIPTEEVEKKFYDWHLEMIGKSVTFILKAIIAIIMLLIGLLLLFLLIKFIKWVWYV